MKYVIAYDIGTTGLKTCIFQIDKTIKLIASDNESYGLYILPDGGAEQDAEEWWSALRKSTKECFEKSTVKIDPKEIAGISFCSQMQGLVLVDKDGNALRRPMSYMDQRAKKEIKDGIANGLQVAGANVFKLIPSLVITGAVSSSVKDPMWKYKWVENNEPELFKKVYKWLDVKDYLICRCTGEFTMTEDSAFGTLLYDTRPGKQGWSKKLCKMFGINTEHLPRIIKSTDKVGGLTAKAAQELGLNEGTPVFGGGGDASLIGVGAGCTNLGDTHIYDGTSGWVITVTDKQMVDVSAMIAAITGAQTNRFNYFAEMETAGKSLEWVKDHLALDEIGIYMQKKHITEADDNAYESLYSYMTDTIKNVEPGSGGVIFTPWLHGNRCPFEDPNATGGFYGVKLETGKTELIRSVLEGVFYHLRWMLECQDKKLKTSNPIRFVGGGALSPVSCQMLADITGRTIETVKDTQFVGSIGAAAVVGVGLGEIDSLDNLKEFIPTDVVYTPNEENHKKYEPYYQTFKKIYKSNKNIYKDLAETKLMENNKAKESWIQALKFGIISASAGIIQAASFALFDSVLKLGWQTSYLTSLVLSVLWNFTINRKVTFKSSSNVPIAMLKVAAFYAVFTPATTALGNFLTGTLHWHDYIATAINMCINLITEFFYDKYFVFRDSLNKEDK